MGEQNFEFQRQEGRCRRRKDPEIPGWDIPIGIAARVILMIPVVVMIFPFRASAAAGVIKPIIYKLQILSILED